MDTCIHVNTYTKPSLILGENSYFLLGHWYPGFYWREEPTNLETFRTSYSSLAEVVKCEQYSRRRPKERHILHLRKGDTQSGSD